MNESDRPLLPDGPTTELNGYGMAMDDAWRLLC